MFAWLTLAIALAGEPGPEPEPEPLVLPTEGRVTLPDPGVIRSALDDDSPIEDADDGAFASILDAWMSGRREVWGARTYIRPLLALRSHDSGRPTVLGLAVGRQWWQLREGPKALAEVGLSGETVLASGLGSWSTELTLLAGAALGPAAIQVGPSFVAERTVLGPVDLGMVAAVAPMAQATLDLRYVQLYGAAAPRFFVSGDRAPAPDVLLGDEPVLRAGAGVALGVLRLSAEWMGRWTVADRVDRFGVGARIRL